MKKARRVNVITFSCLFIKTKKKTLIIEKFSMKIGLTGLSETGMNLAENLLTSHDQVVRYDTDQTKEAEANNKGIIVTKLFKEFLTGLPRKRVVWLIVFGGKSINCRRI